MKRRKFLGRLGLGIAATVVPISILSSIKKIEQNPPHILKERYTVGESETSEIMWVMNKDGNYCWYNYDEVKKQQEFQNKLEFELISTL